MPTMQEALVNAGVVTESDIENAKQKEAQKAEEARLREKKRKEMEKAWEESKKLSNKTEAALDDLGPWCPMCGPGGCDHTPSWY